MYIATLPPNQTYPNPHPIKMAYHGPPHGDGDFDDGHRLHDLPPGNQYHLPPHHGDEDEFEDEHALLDHNNQQGPFNGPFDEHPGRMATPPIRPASNYSLTESYVGDHKATAPPYNGYGGEENYSQPIGDPTGQFGIPGRTESPYERSEASSTEAWRQRQAPGATALKRYATRKVKLIQGSVLSVDYPVPSAIRNAIQAKYRNDLEGGSEEFTHMRCMMFPRVAQCRVC